MKRIILLVTVLALLFVLCGFSNALESSVFSPRLSFRVDGATLICEATLISVGSRIDADMVLRQEGKIITSWTESRLTWLGMEEKYDITADGTYTLELTGTVNDVPFSISKRCKAEPSKLLHGHDYRADAKKFSWSRIVSLDVTPVESLGAVLIGVEYKNGNMLIAEYDETGMTCSVFYNQKRQIKITKYYEKGRTVEAYKEPID